jgi:Uma2 family endonuclease
MTPNQNTKEPPMASLHSLRPAQRKRIVNRTSSVNGKGDEKNGRLSSTVQDEQHILLRNISWETYAHLCEALDGQYVRMSYDGEDLEFMTASRTHDLRKWILARLLETIMEEEGIGFSVGGSMTIKHPKRKRGIETDGCYWIRSAPLIAGKMELDFLIDPPPDLAVEIEYSYSMVNRLGIYAQLRIPEVWRQHHSRIEVGLLQEDLSYAWKQTSPLFPHVPMEGMMAFIEKENTMLHSDLLREMRKWINSGYPMPYKFKRRRRS